jgi:hypothetical protein
MSGRATQPLSNQPIMLLEMFSLLMLTTAGPDGLLRTTQSKSTQPKIWKSLTIEETPTSCIWMELALQDSLDGMLTLPLPDQTSIH